MTMTSHDYRCHGEYFDARFSLKGTEANYAPDRPFDAQHIKLTIKIHFATRSFDGMCETTLRTISDGQKEVKFDAVNFKINSVYVNGRLAASSYDGKKLAITLPRPQRRGSMVKIKIGYHVSHPKLGLTFIKPDRHYPNNPTQVWTQGEDEYARYWFPCIDFPGDRTTTELIAVVPRGFTAVSNGKLEKTRRQGSWWTFHWKQTIPHATYLVTLTVGKFSEIKEVWRGKPVQYFCEEGREADARRAFGKTPKMLEFFSSRIGVQYPYSKYAQIAAHDFIYGGMENTSATTQTDYALLDERSVLDASSDELVAHELAHQWFGDYLTCKSWDHAWLNESFATYFDALFKRHDKGDDEYRYQMLINAREYLSEDKDRYRRPISTNLFRRPSDLFDRHLYEKGSVVLRMLHHQLGEELFWKSINAYVKRNAGNVVETNDLIRAIEDTTGRTMRQFFDEWIFGAGHPEYRVRTWWDARKKIQQVRIVQTNSDLRIFHVKTELLFLVDGKPVRKAISLDKKSQLIDVKLAHEPELVIFDPDAVVLKRVDFVRSEAMLISQLFKDENPVGRIEAALELGKIGSETAADALAEALKSDLFWAVRVEVAKGLSLIRRESVALSLLSALDQVPHLKVRRAIYSALKSMTGRAVAEEIDRRLPQENSYFVGAEALAALVALRHPNARKRVDEFLKQESWNDIRRVAALDALALLKDSSLRSFFVKFTKPGHHQRTRMAAVRALMACGPDASIQNALLQLLDDPFVLLKNVAIRAIQALGDERAIPKLKTLTIGDQDGRTMRLAEEAIESLNKGIS